MSADFQSQSPNPDPASDFNPGTNPADSRHFQTYSDMDPAQNLSDTQQRAIELIIQGHSDTQTARILSINPKTLWRWKNLDEDYRHALTEARHQLHATVTDRYENIVFKATAILLEFLDDSTDSSRMKAAQILLNIASRYKPAPLTKRSPANPLQDHWPEPVLEPKVG
jgi:transposase-like protein